MRWKDAIQRGLRIQRNDWSMVSFSEVMSDSVGTAGLHGEKRSDS
jgi:hypothetical protein